MSLKIDDIRREYHSQALRSDAMNTDPYQQFEQWFSAAQTQAITDVNAMSLATANSAGAVSCRTVLLKGVEQASAGKGFVFYTNYDSVKAQQIEDNSQVALLFAWTAIHQQIEIIGHAHKLSREESCSYFKSRPLGSQLGAWASKQSAIIPQRDELVDRYMHYEEKFGDDVPCPEFWGGYVVIPSSIEFWQGQANRLHDRFIYHVNASHDTWSMSRLAP